MKNWPKPKYSKVKSLHIQFSRLSLLFSKRLKKRNLGLIRSLKTNAEFHLEPKEYDLTICPDNLNITLFLFAFSDLYFLEEFDKLEQGLLNLRSVFGNRFFRNILDKDSFHEWFQNVSSKPFRGGTLNVGWFDFSKKMKTIKSCQINLNQICPSLITLSLVVKPSDQYKKEFEELIYSNANPEFKITKFNLIYGLISSKMAPAFSVRQKQLDEFFLRVNKEIVSLLRKHIGCGFSGLGPLPCIEVLEMNNPLEVVTREYQ